MSFEIKAVAPGAYYLQLMSLDFRGHEKGRGGMKFTNSGKGVAAEAV